jgi:O-antigen/teichoic acid export membrane protein
VPEDVPDAEREALLSIAHGAVVTTGGVSLQRALSFLTELVLTRGLGVELYGLYALGWRITALLRRLATFGTVATLQRYLPGFANDPERQRRYAGLAYLTALLAGLVIGGALVGSADAIDRLSVNHPAFAPALRVFAVFVVAIAVIRVHTGVFRGVQNATGEAFFNRVAMPLTRLLGAVAGIALGFTLAGIVGAMAVGLAAVAVVGIGVTARSTGIRPTLRGARREVGQFYDHAVPIALSGIGKIFQVRVDVLLVGYLITAAAAGVYNVVLLLVSIVTIPLLAFNQLLPPVASGLYDADDVDTLNDVYTTVTRLIVTATVPLVTIMVVYGPGVLGIFGPEYQRGYQALVVFLAGRFVANAVGATGWLLLMTDHQYVRLVLDWLLATLNLALTYWFVLEFGLVGAALGTAVAYSVQNLLQVGVLWHYEGLFPFDRTFMRPIGAGLGMGATMLALREALPGVHPVVGSGLGLVVFGWLSLQFGVDRRDRIVIGELASRYRTLCARAVDRGRLYGR